MSLPKLIKIEVVADKLDVSRRTVERRIREGKLGDVVELSPRDVRLHESAVLAYLAARTVKYSEAH